MRGQKNDEEVVLNWRTNDQIMPRFGRSFIMINTFSSRSNLNIHLKIRPCDLAIKL